MTMPTAKVQVDWDADGSFEATGYAHTGRLARFLVSDAPVVIVDMGEDVTLRVVDKGIVAERGRNQIKSGSPPLANVMNYRLNNKSGDYFRQNTGSPLYPNADVGKDSVWSEVSGATYPVMRGHVKRLIPNAAFGDETMKVTVLSQLASLVDLTGHSSQLYGDGTVANAITTAQALGYVLDKAGLTDVALRAFDAGQTKLLWFVIRPTDELFDLALRILATEGWGAALYDSPDNVTTFKNRFHKSVDARCLNVQATYRDTAAVEPWYVGPWHPDSGEQNVYNSASVPWARRTADAADAAFWLFGETVVLGNSEVRTIVVTPPGDDPIVSIVALASGTDYTVTAGSLVSAVPDRTSGSLLTLTLTAGAGGATLTGLQVRGKLARITGSAQVASTLAAAASIALYGPKHYSQPSLPETEYSVALAAANAVVSQAQLPRAIRVFEVPLVTSGQATATLPRDVSDRIRLVNSRAAFDQEMFIEYMRIERPEGEALRAFIGAEAAGATVTYAVWGTATWGTGGWSW